MDTEKKSNKRWPEIVAEFVTWLMEFCLIAIYAPLFYRAWRKKSKCVDDYTNMDRKFKEWRTVCLDKPANEDDFAALRNSIKLLRRQKAELEKQFTQVKDTATLNQTIQRIQKEIEDREKDLTTGKNLMEKQISSIDLAEYEAKMSTSEKQYQALFTITGIWTLMFFAIALGALAVGWPFRFIWPAHPYLIWLTASTMLFLVSAFLLLKACFQTVREKEEWTIEWLGKYLTTWEAGPHFRFPFLMEISGKVYTGTQSETLYLDQETRDGVMSAKVDFTNAAAEINVNIFYRIIDSYKAVYVIDDVRKSIKEKMESGVRAYFGMKSIDQAIEERTDVDRRKIITQDATEAAVFKDWGIKIESLAVTEIKLPPEIEEQRARVLEAEKSLAVSKIELEQASVKADSETLMGEGKGRALKSLADKAQLTSVQAASFELGTQKYDAYKQAKILIATDSERVSPDFAGALTGASAAIAAKVIEGFKPEEKKNERSATR